VVDRSLLQCKTGYGTPSTILEVGK